MRRMLLVFALLGMVTGGAWAQVGDPHDLTGGVFILHAPPGIDYSDLPSFCQYLGLADCCADQVTEVPCNDSPAQIWFIVSNFYESKTFLALEYGLVWSGDPAGYAPVAEGVCAPGDYLEIPTQEPDYPNWPESGSGIAIALKASDWAGACIPTQWIASYFYCGSGPGQITLTPNPDSDHIGWLSGELTYEPHAIGALGVGMAGVAVCSAPPPDPEACCLGPTCVLLSEASCVTHGGVYYGGSCEPTPCPQPPDPQACCFSSGSCLLMIPEDCTLFGGEVYPQSSCTPTPCPQPPEPEACCFPDGRCILFLETRCVVEGGVYLGGPCNPNPCAMPEPQACCLGPDCALLSPSTCVAQGGVVYPDLTCDPNPCPQPEPQACCLPDGSCVMLLEAACATQDGIFYPGQECATFTCPPPPEPQACCFPDGSCTMLSATGCDAQGGAAHEGEDCATFACPPPPEPMACCLSNGGCMNVFSEAECTGLHGVLFPTEDCGAFACPQPEGDACCFDYDETCYMLAEFDCIDQGGTWYAEQACAVFVCPLWRVCCVHSDCFITTETGCAGMSGWWTPEWYVCDWNPCALPVPSNPNSWGAIKAIYR